jgi:hypothetical protein
MRWRVATGFVFGAAFALGACGGGIARNGGGNSEDGSTGGSDGNAGGSSGGGGGSGGVIDAGSGGVIDAGGGDGGVESGNGLGSDAAAGDSGKANDSGTVHDAAPAPGEAGSDGACSTPTGGTFQCGPTTCDGVTNYCLEKIGGNTCVSIPPACQCGQSHDCACLLAGVANPCGVGTLTCTPMHDGGLIWLVAAECP